MAAGTHNASGGGASGASGGGSAGQAEDLAKQKFDIGDEVCLVVPHRMSTIDCGSGCVVALDEMHGRKIPEGMVGIALRQVTDGAGYLRIPAEGIITWDEGVCHASNIMIEKLAGSRFAACKTLLRLKKGSNRESLFSFSSFFAILCLLHFEQAQTLLRRRDYECREYRYQDYFYNQFCRGSS